MADPDAERYQPWPELEENSFTTPTKGRPSSLLSCKNQGSVNNSQQTQYSSSWVYWISAKTKSHWATCDPAKYELKHLKIVVKHHNIYLRPCKSIKNVVSGRWYYVLCELINNHYTGKINITNLKKQLYHSDQLCSNTTRLQTTFFMSLVLKGAIEECWRYK